MDIFFDLLQRITGRTFAEKKQLISSPFREDRNPSFAIFQWNGIWFFKDFGTGEAGTAVHLLCKSMGLDYATAAKMLKGKIDTVPNVQKEDIIEVSYECSDFSFTADYIKYENSYFHQVGISENITVINSICFAKKISTGNFSYEGDIVIYKNIPSFNRDISCTADKLYIPKNRTCRFLGNRKWHHVFGTNSLAVYDKPYCFISAGEKDACVLQQVFECPAICFNSETYMPNLDMLAWIKSLDRTMVVCYDNDRTGKEKSKALKEKLKQYGIKTHTRYVPEHYKDVTDMFTAEGTVWFE